MLNICSIRSCRVPLNDRHFAKLGGDWTTEIFILAKFTFLKIGNKIFDSIKILICYEYIKNNSYINFGDGSHIRIVDLVVMQSNAQCPLYH